MISDLGNNVLARTYSLTNMSDMAEYYLGQVANNPEVYLFEESYFAEDTGTTTYVYRYVVDEIKTTDKIVIVINQNGEMISYVKPCEGLFVGVKNGVDIENAKKELSEKLLKQNIEDYNVKDEYLTFDEDGELAISFYVLYSNDGNECIERILIKVQ